MSRPSTTIESLIMQNQDGTWSIKVQVICSVEGQSEPRVKEFTPPFAFYYKKVALDHAKWLFDNIQQQVNKIEAEEILKQVGAVIK